MSHHRTKKSKRTRRIKHLKGGKNTPGNESNIYAEINAIPDGSTKMPIIQHKVVVNHNRPTRVPVNEDLYARVGDKAHHNTPPPLPERPHNLEQLYGLQRERLGAMSGKTLRYTPSTGVRPRNGAVRRKKIN
jgi:hypothetical protein